MRCASFPAAARWSSGSRARRGDGGRASGRGSWRARPQRSRAGSPSTLALAIGLFASPTAAPGSRPSATRPTTVLPRTCGRAERRSGSIPALQLRGCATRASNGVRSAASRLPRGARPVGFIRARDPARDRCDRTAGAVSFRGDLANRPLCRDARSPRREPSASRAGRRYPGRPTQLALDVDAESPVSPGPHTLSGLVARPSLSVVIRDAGGLLYRLPTTGFGSRARESRIVYDLWRRTSTPALSTRSSEWRRTVIRPSASNRPVSVDVHSVEVGDGSGSLDADRPAGAALAGELEPDRWTPTSLRVVRVSSDGLLLSTSSARVRCPRSRVAARSRSPLRPGTRRRCGAIPRSPPSRFLA